MEELSAELAPRISLADALTTPKPFLLLDIRKPKEYWLLGFNAMILDRLTAADSRRST
jgi:hypothetical protein